jgi:hypothetical protein
LPHSHREGTALACGALARTWQDWSGILSPETIVITRVAEDNVQSGLRGHHYAGRSRLLFRASQ